ncbi:MAG: sensor histidine kinase, partial [Puniceicoccales bacterium]
MLINIPQVLHKLSPNRLGIVAAAMAFLMVTLCVGLFYATTVGLLDTLMPESTPADDYARSLAHMRWMVALALLLGAACSALLGWLAANLRRFSHRQFQERAQAEEEMRLAKESAENALLAKRELLSIAAHDLKNPLAAIVGVSDMTAHYLKSVPNRYIPEGTRNLFFKIPRYADNMLSIIEEVLKAETIDRIGMQVADKPFNATEVCNEVVEFNRFAARKKKITIHYVCDRAFFLLGDRDRIMEALDNLISNAVKYSPPKSRVDIALGCDLAQSRLRFSVTDEGPGLSLEDQQKLFQKFQKLSAKPTGGESSSGLGLSIVKHIVEAHNGTVTCESEEG